MVKRKREVAASAAAPAAGVKTARFAPATTGKKSQSTKASIEPAVANHNKPTSGSLSIQIVTGSYERILHGFATTVSAPVDGPDKSEQAQQEPTYSDTFLFAAHTSAVRCLAVSAPNESHKRVLATGSTDERINLFHLSTSPPVASMGPKLPTLSATSVIENPRNRELGSLLHHSRSVNKLQFPTRGKLFSAADDNTVAISRTRDWTVLSTIKCPIPKIVGRPSGDTAGPGEVPTGVNDFAIHPSMKVMVTVGKGERSMRLWNLVTGKKAGVLNFDKSLLQAAGEGRYSSGEGRKLVWGQDGEEYVVGFERGAVVYGMVSGVWRTQSKRICD
jgi:protein MAK11